MIQKKVCLLGSAAVGKTSLLQRFIYRGYTDTHLPTIGVRIEKRELTFDGRDLVFILWDIDALNEERQLRPSYLRGASGYLLVADGTRRETFETACDFQERVERVIGKVPFLLMINKADLEDAWAVDEAMLNRVEQRGWSVWHTSARTGTRVDEAFNHLARLMLE